MTKLKKNAESLQSCVSVSVTDLRIGNLLYFPFHNENVIVCGLPMLDNGKKGIQVGTKKTILCEELLLQFKPIPLTEEWLLEFGFEEDEVWVDRIKKIQNNRMIGIDLKTNHIFLSQYDNHKHFRDVFIIECKYVHQLQNLYHALTGSELQIGNLTEH